MFVLCEPHLRWNVGVDCSNLILFVTNAPGLEADCLSESRQTHDVWRVSKCAGMHEANKAPKSL